MREFSLTYTPKRRSWWSDVIQLGKSQKNSEELKKTTNHGSAESFGAVIQEVFINWWFGGFMSDYCKSRIFPMHCIFVYLICGCFRLKIKWMWKVQSKSKNLQRPATVRKCHAYERSEIPSIQKLVLIQNILDLQYFLNTGGLHRKLYFWKINQSATNFHRFYKPKQRRLLKNHQKADGNPELWDRPINRHAGSSLLWVSWSEANKQTNQILKE